MDYLIVLGGCREQHIAPLYARVVFDGTKITLSFEAPDTVLKFECQVDAIVL